MKATAILSLILSKHRHNSHIKPSTNHYLLATSYHLPSTTRAFTIIELLVVIVVIGILAAITVVSYTGITQKATAASIQSNLSGAKTKLRMYYVEYDTYPATMSTPDAQTLCPSAPTIDNKYCIKSSPGNAFTYARLSPSTYYLINTHTASTAIYHITENSTPTTGAYVEPSNPADWLTIGTQTWAKANLNVGTMVTGATNQTNNAILEKYCYNNLESNCTTYGGLYQWDEAMQYTTTNGAQGICPAGSHIPTDAEWTTLITYYGGESVAGTAMKASPLSISLAGYRYVDGSFIDLSSYTSLWSSLEWDTSAWSRDLYSSYTDADRFAYYKDYGSSVRCLQN